MTKILVDETLRTKLHDLTQPLELCDAEGHILGRFTPVLDPRCTIWSPRLRKKKSSSVCSKKEAKHTPRRKCSPIWRNCDVSGDLD